MEDAAVEGGSRREAGVVKGAKIMTSNLVQQTGRINGYGLLSVGITTSMWWPGDADVGFVVEKDDVERRIKTRRREVICSLLACRRLWSSRNVKECEGRLATPNQ